MTAKKNMWRFTEFLREGDSASSIWYYLQMPTKYATACKPVSAIYHPYLFVVPQLRGQDSLFL